MLEFIKCHGSGNDFILIDEMTHNYTFTEDERRELSLLLCDRNDGVGSDGILFVMDSEKAQARMRMFNSDGTEAEMCGNGLRCVARHVIEQVGHSNVKIETQKAVLAVEQVAEIYDGIDTFSVAIEPVSFEVASLPMNFEKSEALDEVIPELSSKLTFTALSVPNPHIVTIVDEVDQADLKATGEKANQLTSVFPRGVNVSFVQILEKNKIFVQTYERGVGLTNACGTAMSASTLVSTILGPNELDVPIVVINKGGLVNCVVEKAERRYTIQLRGNATNVYTAAIEVDLENKRWDWGESTTHQNEIDIYEKLKDYAASQV
ncbi:diaminopimelate epimerase [Halobacillus andaensis]|uniref:Diaminopimelate epimerase n=1 Tax=Halobacillus andaensis TaxID=1176239 RepID=A0A917AZJ2_HALAA|nr:diaminopimelate epimerase [Halobacillus andaensis]MBP2003740.1 diaminopimelate epimerase [Halobacillus andaensis]GGF12852.1 diaminopimelate epimerase [Halobacillus andaensis]